MDSEADSIYDKPHGPKRKEKGVTEVLRGIPGVVQKVARAAEPACSLRTQGSTAQPLVGRRLQGALPVCSLFSASQSCKPLT